MNAPATGNSLAPAAAESATDLVAWAMIRTLVGFDTTSRDSHLALTDWVQHTGVIRGATARNIVPRDCAFEFEIRHLPFDDPDEIFRRVEAYAHGFRRETRAVAPDSCIAFDALSTTSGLDTLGDSDIAALGGACSGTHDARNVSFGTEAPLFDQASIATIIGGPGHVAQARQPNEWVSLAQPAACEAFMRHLAERVCVPRRTAPRTNAGASSTKALP